MPLFSRKQIKKLVAEMQMLIKSKVDSMSEDIACNGKLDLLTFNLNIRNRELGIRSG